MGERWSNWIAQLRALPPGRQLLLGATSAISLAFLFWTVTRAAAPDEQVLFRGLAPEEAVQVADSLASEQIPYRLDDGGTTILVAASRVPEARIRIAGKGLPSGGGAGFELFDRPAFGVTDFVHRVNYVRAIQGELVRSIEQLEPVQRARVQLVVPDRRTVLRAAERRPTASVVLRLRPGHELAHGQVRAVVHLVASSVEGMAPDEVTVVDGSGRLLAPLGDESLPGAVADGAPEGSSYQQRVEHELASRVESILEKTVGRGGVVARVRAEMDWTRSETTEEIFDPDSQVARSEQRSTETSSEGDGLAGGVPGVASNGPDAGAAARVDGATASNSERTSETVNYEISKKTSHRLTPMGRIERLSVAVLVADRPPAEAGGEPVPWDADSLGLFDALARQAVGFSEERGDRITVQSAPFRQMDVPLPDDGGWLSPHWIPLLTALARGAAVLAALVLFARLVVRPAVRALGEGSGARLPARVSDLEGQLAGGGAAAPGGALPAQGSQVPAVRTEEGVRTLRNWLNQG